MAARGEGAHAPAAPHRRAFMKCMAWGGTGLLWTMHGGVLRAQAVETGTRAGTGGGSFSFVQLSDSHIGFHQAPNPDVQGTLREAVAKVNALATQPDFVLHTGDVSHLARPEEFDTARGLMQALKARAFYVPGEHDTIGDQGRRFFDVFGQRGTAHGAYSFDHGGAHFIGLVNVVDLKPGGLGALGPAQLEWLEDDVKGRSSSTPIVVFAHMPLWTVYEPWGWGTADSGQALSYLRRFGSVTVLNGHIHQVVQKVEGNVSFYTARSTAYPIPAAGTVPAPGPDARVAPGRLHDLIGVREVRYVAVDAPLAVTDAALAARAVGTGTPAVARSFDVRIADFQFQPAVLTVPAGTRVTWTNRDSSPHTVTGRDARFVSSAGMDTGDRFSAVFDAPGTYEYFCSLHPMMVGKVVVTRGS